MKKTQKNKFSLKRFNSMTQDYYTLNGQHSQALQISNPSIFKEDLDQTQPMSDPTIGKFSTFIAVSGASLNQINEFDEQDSRVMNTGSLDRGSNSPIKKNPRLAQSFNDFSQSESDVSQVIFIGSRDLADKKLLQFAGTKSFKFNDLVNKQNKQEQVKTQQKRFVRIQEYKQLERKNKQLQIKNRSLLQKNQKLEKKIGQLQRSSKKMEPPEFIKVRQAKKNLKSTLNATYAHNISLKSNLNFKTQFKKSLNQQILGSARKRDIPLNPVRATFSTGKDLEKTIKKIREEYQRRNKVNQSLKTVQN